MYTLKKTPNIDRLNINQNKRTRTKCVIYRIKEIDHNVMKLIIFVQ